ncbi:MAG: aminopeptidase, partial [Thermoplasmata archaeon]
MSTVTITKKEKNEFSEFAKISVKLTKAAEVAVREVLAVKKDEKVLIITNPVRDVFNISQALYDAVIEAGGRPTMVVQPKKTQLDFAEPATIKAIESKPDVIISISAEKLGKDESALKTPIIVKDKDGKTKKYDHIFTYFLNEKQIRAFWSPSISAKMFAETVPIDYKELRENCAKLQKCLDDASEVQIQTEKGCDITICISGRKAKCDDGNFTEAGKGGNLPAGEVFISPEVGKSYGVIVFDGSISLSEGEVVLEKPIKCKVENGYVTEIAGGEEAKKLKETLEIAREKPMLLLREGKITKETAEEYAKNAYHLGELGIGLNKAAKIVGNMLEDEKVYRTCHIAIGANYDEDANAFIHLDGLIKSPTITVRYPDG